MREAEEKCHTLEQWSRTPQRQDVSRGAHGCWVLVRRRADSQQQRTQQTRQLHLPSSVVITLHTRKPAVHFLNRDREFCEEGGKTFGVFSAT